MGKKRKKNQNPFAQMSGLPGGGDLRAKLSGDLKPLALNKGQQGKQRNRRLQNETVPAQDVGSYQDLVNQCRGTEPRYWQLNLDAPPAPDQLPNRRAVYDPVPPLPRENRNIPWKMFNFTNRNYSAKQVGGMPQVPGKYYLLPGL